MHDAARVDRQLIGRCGRQGDPGTYWQFLALDDDILLGGYGPDKAERLKERGEKSARHLRRSARAIPQSAAEHRAAPFPRPPGVDVS